MKERIKLRIKELVDDNSLNANRIAKTQADQRRLNRQLNEGSDLTLPTIIDIIDCLPNVSCEWLMRGEGSMYISDLPSTDHDDSDEVLELKAEVTRLRAERDELAHKLAISERRIDKLIDILYQDPSSRTPFAADERVSYADNTMVG